MNLLENLGSSITGKVDKAILCVKKPVKAQVPAGGALGAFSGAASAVGINVSGSNSAIGLQAALVSAGKSGLGGGIFSFFPGSEMKEFVAGLNGYHVLKVKYNPSKIQFDSRAGSFIQPGPGGAGTNTLSQITMPPQTFMSFELIFDEENSQDAFMFEKGTNLSAGAIISDFAGGIKNIMGEGYTVRPEVEALIGMLTQSETRQVVFCWDKMVFAGEVVSIDARYTMFNPIGNPVRAVVRFSIRQGTTDSKQSKADVERENKYWDDAFDKLDGGGSGIMGKVGNLLNFK